MGEKPLGRKAYGSIPHLPQSRMGAADKACHGGQARIATEKPRDKRDRIIVQEKLDGSCCAVANVDGVVVPLGRAGYRAETSPFEQHHLFADWVMRRQELFRDLIRPGERLVGEWLAQAHSTRYRLEHEPFVVFDLMVGVDRAPYRQMVDRLGERLPLPAVAGYHAMGPDEALAVLGTYGMHGAADPIEGAVWRVERDDRVDFLVKYVRPDKQDGVFLPEVSGGEAVWNWRPAEVKT